MNFIHGITKNLIDLLFPISCVGCGKDNTHCCSACTSKIDIAFRITEQTTCTVISAAPLCEGSMLSRLIHRFKYDGARELGNFLITLLPKRPRNLSSYAILVPVPLHTRRFNERGFNQSDILSRAISIKWNLSTCDFIQRHRYTRPQVELEKHERAQNVKNAFSIKDNRLKLDPALHYVLVDDVTTTGATLNECNKVLRKHGAAYVDAVVIGKAI